MKLLIVGDTHANTNWTKQALEKAAFEDCEKMFIVGDFGFVFYRDDYKDLDRLSSYAVQIGTPIYFLPGNHENHDVLDEWYAMMPKTEENFVEIRPNIFYTGRVNQWKWDDKTFTSIGGAVSIDRQWRQEIQTPNRPLWWSREVLYVEDWQKAYSFEETDVLLSHDAPEDNPFNTWLKIDELSKANREKMTRLALWLRPKIWIHGHYHERASYPFYYGRNVCEVTSLKCDGYKLSDSTVVLDTNA